MLQFAAPFLGGVTLGVLSVGRLLIRGQILGVSGFVRWESRSIARKPFSVRTDHCRVDLITRWTPPYRSLNAQEFGEGQDCGLQQGSACAWYDCRGVSAVQILSNKP